MSLLRRAEKIGEKFQNPVPTEVGGFSLMRKVLPQYLKNRAETEPKAPLGPFRTDVSVFARDPSSGLRVTWFGHSSSLVEMDGVRVLIDPVWDERASPVTFAGPKRFFAPTMELEALPKLDVVLISHDHYDHLGAETVRRLARWEGAAEARWITSLGVGRRLRGFGVAAGQIVEMDWTETVRVGALEVTAWPARHFSGRGVGDRFKTLWGAFALEGPRHRVFYGADSGYWDGFGKIAAHYRALGRRFDLTMLEIGAFHPLWAAIHLGPEGAARAHEAMGETAGLLMPIHWGLFNLALHGWREPIEEMVAQAEARGLTLWAPEPGKPSEVLAGQGLLERWWG